MGFFSGLLQLRAGVQQIAAQCQLRVDAVLNGKAGTKPGLALLEHPAKDHPVELRVAHHPVMPFQVGLLVDPEIGRLLVAVAVDQRAAEGPGPITRVLLIGYRRPELDHRAFMEKSAVPLHERAAFGNDRSMDHLLARQSEYLSLLPDDQDMARRPGLNQFVGDFIRKERQEIQVSFEKRRKRMVSGEDQIVDVPDLAVPVQPELLKGRLRDLAGLETPHESAAAHFLFGFFEQIGAYLARYPLRLIRGDAAILNIAQLEM